MKKLFIISFILLFLGSLLLIIGMTTKGTVGYYEEKLGIYIHIRDYCMSISGLEGSLFDVYPTIMDSKDNLFGFPLLNM